MVLKSKKGLSPVVATVLLISLALILAIIIFIWARSFIGEKLEKDLGGGAVDIESACKEIVFQASAISQDGKLMITVNNQGNVPIYALDIKEKDGKSIKNLVRTDQSEETLMVSNGETRSVTLTESVSPGTELVLIPVILGQAKDSTTEKSFVCDESIAETVTVE